MKLAHIVIIILNCLTLIAANPAKSIDYGKVTSGPANMIACADAFIGAKPESGSAGKFDWGENILTQFHLTDLYISA